MVQIIGPFGRVQCGQQAAQLPGMLGVEAACAAGREKQLQPFVTNVLQKDELYRGT